MIRGIWGGLRGLHLRLSSSSSSSLTSTSFAPASVLCSNVITYVQYYLTVQRLCRSTFHENICLAICCRRRHVLSLHSSVLALVSSSTVAVLCFVLSSRFRVVCSLQSRLWFWFLCSQFSLHLAWLCLSIQVISRKLC